MLKLLFIVAGTAAYSLNTPSVSLGRTTTLRISASSVQLNAADSDAVDAADAAAAADADAADSPAEQERLEFAQTQLRDALDQNDPVSTTPQLTENDHFKCDTSVAAWADFQRAGEEDAVSNAGSIATAIGGIATQGPDAAAYAATHGLRTGYFVANAVLGSLASELHERVRGNGGGGATVGSIGGGEEKSGGSSGSSPLATLDASITTRLALEAALCYETDWKRINAGEYKAPWDMTVGHRQATARYAARQTARFVREAVGTRARRNRGAPEDVGVWYDSPLYPDYFLNNFHYQTDGWLSRSSAEVYETSTETLFLGRQDCMQRPTLLPIKKAAADVSGRPLRILEVACGTGRFSTFVRDNYPDAEVTLVDLSPFYLEKARDNDKYWRQRRGTKETPPATFVQANAEKLPFEDGAFDAVLNVYLFHEMPAEARAAAAAEFARVAKLGGVVVLTDSIQLGDRPALDDKMSNFGKLNEPHYVDYLNCDLPSLFEGLTPDEKWITSTSKTLSFRKPVTEEGESE